jgi:hypothetical protein
MVGDGIISVRIMITKAKMLREAMTDMSIKEQLQDKRLKPKADYERLTKEEGVADFLITLKSCFDDVHYVYA